MKNATYFVSSYWSLAGAPLLERSLVATARKLFLHHSVREADFDRMLDVLDDIQDRDWKANRRLKRCTIGICKMDDDICYLHIGDSCRLTMTRDKGLLTFSTEE